MPVETDINNLLDRMNDTCAELETELPALKQRIELIQTILSSRNNLRNRIDSIHVEMDTLLDAVGKLSNYE